MTDVTGLTVREVDHDDDADVARWHAAYDASQRHGREATATAWTLPEITVALREVSERRWRRAYVAELGGRVVGAGSLAARLLDNREAAETGVDVLPEERGRGVGTALLTHLEDVCRSRGLTVLQGEVAWPYDAAPDGAGEPSVEWALAAGFSLGIVDVQRHLALPVDLGLLDELAERAAAVHAAPGRPTYSLRTWVGRVPDDLVDGWAALTGTLMTEAPTGGMDREVERTDASTVREGEALLAAQGRTRYCCVALDEHGTVVAYTDIATMVHEPGRSYQWGTLVHRDHRGRRLGLAVKVANLRLLQIQRPDVTEVRTWNAEVNAHMVGVNVDLGFVPVERLGEMQKRL